MQKVYVALLLATCLSMGACSDVYDVSFDYDEKALKSSIRTFDWMPLVKKKKQRVDEITYGRIQDAAGCALLESVGDDAADRLGDQIVRRERVLGDLAQEGGAHGVDTARRKEARREEIHAVLAVVQLGSGERVREWLPSWQEMAGDHGHCPQHGRTDCTGHRAHRSARLDDD